MDDDGDDDTMRISPGDPSRIEVAGGTYQGNIICVFVFEHVCMNTKYTCIHASVLALGDILVIVYYETRFARK